MLLSKVPMLGVIIEGHKFLVLWCVELIGLSTLGKVLWWLILNLIVIISAGHLGLVSLVARLVKEAVIILIINYMGLVFAYITVEKVTTI
jgi:hypothetical protein